MEWNRVWSEPTSVGVIGGTLKWTDHVQAM